MCSAFSRDSVSTSSATIAQLAKERFNNVLFANMIMLGFAWQKGVVEPPTSAQLMKFDGFRAPDGQAMNEALLPEAEREKVFARFHTARPEAEGFGDHSGLGLAIARTIAEAHDGSLTVADRADGKPGACLVLELPAA